MLVIAHRGASGEFAENTLAAFSAACGQGADMIELDIHQTADGKLVVRHDSHFDDGTDISELSCAEVMARAEAMGIRMPLLDQALDCITASGVKVNIEIKQLSDLSLIDDVIKKYGYENILFSSFNHPVIAQLKKNHPYIEAGTLMVSRLLDHMSAAASLNSDIIIQHCGSADQEFVDMVHGSGRRIYVWVVNHARDIKHFMDMGVDGIFTDYPARARSIADAA